MKIGITCYPSVGGSGIIATELGIQLAEKGHEVHFITSNVPFRLNASHPNIHIHQTDINDYSVFKYPPYDITLASKISEVITEYDLDLIHMHYAVPHAVCGILARQMSGRDVRIVTTLHGTDITVLGHDMSLVNAIRFGIEGSDAVTAVSDSLTRETHELIKTDKSIDTIYNFVEESYFNMKDRETIRLRMKERYGISEGTKVLMHTSNFRKIKRIDDIVRAFSIVQKNLDSVLVLIGDGPETNSVKQLVKELGIEDSVILAGQQSDVKSFYMMSDIFLLLSQKESFGLALLEAMHCGSVPIGSAAGGISEVIKDGETGYIVDVGDYTAAAENIIELLTDGPLYKTIQQQMLQDINIRFHSDVIVREYEALYQKLVGDTHHG
ncbi:N-acetyl-alpha-D-glucosaminyl L-malate synthase BshA [Salinicoccus halodurans]|uniref:N-acetyl-alpha-D-glucosaminyl L-malate synthase n=1 Tax=Salinicoccus halodurans TaxID=407035 RepID=A0A0F7D4E4_9STAP|nr:N-acetyl-alpha-D-glucosaminyl L-malate synthase BshA [Salinicoccus halodurans]AKG74090.1 N-acetyl-alpha-D-glucosaminyl L-malate synthase [Salinicoccus halodurans]SFK60336.1 N-acetyl-alpha-D-glucosaminyl L-malate synthase BshA [Salinicoccus halodurans]